MAKQNSPCPAQELLRFLSQPHMLTIIYTLDRKVWGFNQLQKVTGINTRTLTKRLQELQEEKIISVVDCPKDARCRYYQLSPRGKKMRTILQKLS